MQPIVMPPNIIDHFYLGGSNGSPSSAASDMPSPRRPEEWLAATTFRAGEPGVGPSRTESGALLRDLVAADPTGWVGSFRRSRPGTTGSWSSCSTPSPATARPRAPGPQPSPLSHLNCPYGKTEAWFVLGHLRRRSRRSGSGSPQDVDPDELSRPRGGTGLAVDALPDAPDRRASRATASWCRPAPPTPSARACSSRRCRSPAISRSCWSGSITTATREESHLGPGHAAGAERHRPPRVLRGRVPRSGWSYTPTRTAHHRRRNGC